jgi:hypothetical protein
MANPMSTAKSRKHIAALGVKLFVYLKIYKLSFRQIKHTSFGPVNDTHTLDVIIMGHKAWRYVHCRFTAVIVSNVWPTLDGRIFKLD